MLLSLVKNVELILKSIITFQLVSMKLVAILVILYKSTYQNKSNYILFFIIFYLYLASTKINTITFYNYLGLFVLHNVLLKKLRKITKSSAA